MNSYVGMTMGQDVSQQRHTSHILPVYILVYISKKIYISKKTYVDLCGKGYLCLGGQSHGGIR